MRRGVTMPEVMVAALVGVMVVYVAWNALIFLGRSEKAVDREAARAMMEARVTEQLMQDLRSAAQPIEPAGGGQFKITRWMPVGGAIELRAVTWTLRDAAPPLGPCLVRQVDGETPKEFWFTGLVRPDDPRFVFKIEEVPDDQDVP